MIKVVSLVMKHSFGPVNKSAEYLLAMEDFRNLKTGDAMDADFLWRTGRALNLPEAAVPREEINRRGDAYLKLKYAILESVKSQPSLEGKE